MNWLAIDAGPAENLHRSRGIGVFARALAMSLSEDGLEPGIRYLSCRPVGPASERWMARSPSARLTGVNRRLPDRLSIVWQLAETAWVLPRDVRRTGADVFLATDPNAIAVDRRFSTVAMLYDLIPLVFPEQYLRGLRATLRRLAFADSIRRLRKAATIIAISNATRDDALRLLGIARSRIEVVRLAVDRTVFHPNAADGRASLTGGAPYLLYVGEADSRKNVAGLIEAFRALAMDDLHLVLAGASESTRRRLRPLCGPEPDSRIHLLGPVDVASLASLYAGAMAFVFPSVYEGFGLPVLEAMASGAPVICYPRSAMLEVAGSAVLFADPDRSGSLLEAIRRVAREPELRAELRGRGLEQAARFSWHHTRDGIIHACRAARLRRV